MIQSISLGTDSLAVRAGRDLVPLENSVSYCELGLLRDRQRGWDHLQVLLSLVYQLLRCLFDLLAELVRSDLSKDAELLVLRHENRCYAVKSQAACGGITPTGSG